MVSNSSPQVMRSGKRAVGEEVEVDPTKRQKINSFISTASDATTGGTTTEMMGGKANGSSSGYGVGNGKAPMTAAVGEGNSPDIDEDLHSRQLAVYGRETMRRLFASNVLVSGMNGLGAEIAKNLVLAGVKSVTLHDEGNVELWDLSSNFIFSEDDVGKNRALASIQKLQELNNSVVISTLTAELTKEQLSDFQAVVFTDISLEKAIEFDDYCHSHQPPIALIKSEVRGLFGSVFCDFGPEFTVFDVDGEDPHTGIIASISNDNSALVACVDDERLEFQDGDLVVFSEVHGMVELNDGRPRKVKNARPYSFMIEEDTTNYTTYEKGGIVTQVKQPKKMVSNSSPQVMRPGKRAVGEEVEVDPTKRQKINSLISTASDATTGGTTTEMMGGKANGSSSDYGVGNGKAPMTAAVGEGNSPDIDEDLHSRQLAVYGRETMRRLFASNVLVSGMNGLGAEIAKNLVLAGVKSVTLHDEGNVELWDLSSNFIFSEDDVGKNRALASIQKLQELNNSVVISTLTAELTKEQLSDFQAVVFTDISLEKAIEFDDYCHSHQPPIALIKSEVRGLFGSVFCDFGPEFTVFDVDGEDPHTGIIASISNDNSALVACVDDERLEFQDGDLVVFSEVHGMVELNDGRPRKVKNARPYSFMIEEDTTNYTTYEKGGIVTQVKQPKVLNFKPLREALKEPDDFLLSDFSKFDRPPLLHLAFQALDKFITELGRFPVAGSEEDVQKLISLVTNMNSSSEDGTIEEVHRNLLRNFAFGARAVLNPMAAMFGGIVGQEVVKACSGKFHPLFQFFYFDSAESLPSEPLDPSDLKPLNCRYDAQISVFGAKLQKKLEDAQVFIVGSGALGCEFLKNVALMGVCCGNQGKLTITDDDVIEKSNLSRQFLFRDWNIGEAKSTVAASAASLINPNLHIEALQNRASPETENVFDDTYWENLSVVINALDNVNARLYVDQRCLYFQKPLLESGTLGAKCNTQMVIPYLTENYGASRDPPEKQAPMCTLHSFPHNIDHCLTWARSEFEGLLEKTPAEVNAYLTSPSEYTSAMKSAGDAQARDNLERVLDCLDGGRCETFQDCIAWARFRFEDYFANRVKQLTFTFPEDAVTSNGTPFWSAPKRFPLPLQFSADDPTHLQFVMAGSILRAETFGILIPDRAKSPKKLADAVKKVEVPDFQPKRDAKIVTDEQATSLSTASIDDAAVINELVVKLEICQKKLPPGFKMNPVQFEKDDDTNYHMDLIAGLANMRARNYSIPEVDKLKAKFIAGRIIPAIATSTAMATGLVCLELYKVLNGGHKLEDYRNTFVNLALPLFSIAEPVPPKVIKHQDTSWTAWDRWTVSNNPTLKELLQWLENKGLSAYSISYGSCLLYNSMFPRHKERLDRKMVDLVREVAKADLPPYRQHFDIVVACEDDEDNDVDIPQISIYFR